MNDASELTACDPSIDVDPFNGFNNNTTSSHVLTSPARETVIQPLYITIGPPCSGKTTWVRRKESDNADAESIKSEIFDVCIDDQPGVYLRVPIDYFSPVATFNDNDKNKTIRQQYQSNIVFGRSIKERMQDLSELRAVLLRLASITTKDEFQQSMCTPAAVDVVEEIINEFESKQQPLVLPNTVDLFVMDAIFRRPPSTHSKRKATNDIVNDSASLSALERIEQLLYNTPTSTPIAFGNTNTRPTDYVKALQMALKLKRPVQFVVYCDDEGNFRFENNDIFDLTAENGLQGLIRRNMYRFLQTGRYVPVQVITDMRDRTHNMINDIITQQQVAAANAEVHNSPLITMTKLEFHQHLARIAGFVMNDERIITSSIRAAPDMHNETRKLNNAKHDRPIKSNASSRQRPWDRPASAVRGYNGQLNNLNRSKLEK